MKINNEKILLNHQLNDLRNDLDELYTKAGEILKHKSDNIIEDLLLSNTKESKELASDIIDIQDEICTLNDIYDHKIIDDPFNTLCDEDEE